MLENECFSLKCGIGEFISTKRNGTLQDLRCLGLSIIRQRFYYDMKIIAIKEKGSEERYYIRLE